MWQYMEVHEQLHAQWQDLKTLGKLKNHY